MRFSAFLFAPIVHQAKTRFSRLKFHPRVGLTERIISSLSAIEMEKSKPNLDVDYVRNDMVEAARSVAHFNSAGDSPMPLPVLERVTKHLECEAALGGYEAAARCEGEIKLVYESAAQLINASAGEIALQESASMAWARAFYALAQELKPGDRILTGMIEYGANYVAMLQVSRRTGAVVEVVPSDKWGLLDVAALGEMLRAGRVKVVAITHVPTNGGVINPAKEVGHMCREHGVLFFLDACQSMGQLRVDVQDIGCHVLCATGRKFLRGPRGTGFLYISREAMSMIGEPPMIDHYAAPCVEPGRYELRSDARRFEFWEANVAGRLGLGVALRYAMELGMQAIEDRIRHVARALRNRIAREPRVTIMDLGRGETQCGIVSFTVAGAEAGAIKQSLRSQGVYVSTSSTASTPLDARDRSLPTVVRASVHYFNNEEDLDKFMLALHRAMQDFPHQIKGVP